MAADGRKTKRFVKLPWVGGLNNTVDSGILSPDFIVAAENVTFETSGSRKV